MSQRPLDHWAHDSGHCRRIPPLRACPALMQALKPEKACMPPPDKRCNRTCVFPAAASPSCHNGNVERAFPRPINQYIAAHASDVRARGWIYIVSTVGTCTYYTREVTVAFRIGMVSKRSNVCRVFYTAPLPSLSNILEKLATVAHRFVPWGTASISDNGVPCTSFLSPRLRKFARGEADREGQPWKTGKWYR